MTAVDLAATMLRRGAENVAARRLTARIGLVVASATALPYRSGDFDVVVSNSLAHHIPEPARLFAAMARVAGDGAVFVRDLARPTRPRPTSRPWSIATPQGRRPTPERCFAPRSTRR